MPPRTLSRHRTSLGEVAYLRQPDGSTHVVLDGRAVAVGGPLPPLEPDAPNGLRSRIGFRALEAGLHLLADHGRDAA